MAPPGNGSPTPLSPRNLVHHPGHAGHRHHAHTEDPPVAGTDAGRRLRPLTRVQQPQRTGIRPPRFRQPHPADPRASPRVGY